MSKWLRDDQHNIHSIIIIKDGKLIYERYTDNLTRHANFESYSVTKVISALLLGKVMEQNGLSLATEIEPFLRQARPDLASQFADKRGINVGHLLCMSSGLGYEDKEYASQIYFKAPDFLAHTARAKALRAPGTEWNYNDINPIYLSALIAQASGKTLPELAESSFFDPMHMSHYVWGNGDKAGINSAGWGIRLRTVDLAKFGLLILNHGRWNGRQLTPASWVSTMQGPCGTVDFAGPGPLFRQAYVKSEPEYTTSGFKGQFITVLPQSNTVIAVNGTFDIDPDEDFFFNPNAPAGSIDPNKQIYHLMLNRYILPAIHPTGPVEISQNKRAALYQELQMALRSKGKANISVDAPDLPQR
jgi:CubicO group peptidase (beta-lactamase class C family)